MNLRPQILWLLLLLLIATPARADREQTDVPGRWHRIRPGIGELSPEERARMEELGTLGYMAGTEVAMTDETVTVYDPERCHDGFNFYVAGHAPAAYLVDMEGKLLHEWGMAYSELWDDYEPGRPDAGMDSWRRAYLFENGDILAIFEGFGIIKLDKDSNLIWAKKNNAHHDLEVLPDGSIYVLTFRQQLNPKVHAEREVREDYVTRLSADGEELESFSLVDAFDQGDIDWRNDEDARAAGDIMHTNTLFVIPEGANCTVEWLKPGYILSSSRTLSLVTVIDPRRQIVVKALDGGWFRQHDPQLLPSGNILLFDNLGRSRLSTAIEFDPQTGETVWFYGGTKEMPLRSDWCGSVARFPDGNTLINETEAGRSVEVTHDGEIVWEFYIPHRVGEDPVLIASLYDLVRLSADFDLSWANAAP